MEKAQRDIPCKVIRLTHNSRLSQSFQQAFNPLQFLLLLKTSPECPPLDFLLNIQICHVLLYQSTRNMRVLKQDQLIHQIIWKIDESKNIQAEQIQNRAIVVGLLNDRRRCIELIVSRIRRSGHDIAGIDTILQKINTIILKLSPKKQATTKAKEEASTVRQKHEFLKKKQRLQIKSQRNCLSRRYKHDETMTQKDSKLNIERLRKHVDNDSMISKPTSSRIFFSAVFKEQDSKKTARNYIRNIKRAATYFIKKRQPKLPKNQLGNQLQSNDLSRMKTEPSRILTQRNFKRMGTNNRETTIFGLDSPKFSNQPSEIYFKASQNQNLESQKTRVTNTKKVTILLPSSTPSDTPVESLSNLVIKDLSVLNSNQPSYKFLAGSLSPPAETVDSAEETQRKSSNHEKRPGVFSNFRLNNLGGMAEQYDINNTEKKQDNNQQTQHNPIVNTLRQRRGVIIDQQNLPLSLSFLQNYRKKRTIKKSTKKLPSTSDKSISDSTEKCPLQQIIDNFGVFSQNRSLLNLTDFKKLLVDTFNTLQKQKLVDFDEEYTKKIDMIAKNQQLKRHSSLLKKHRVSVVNPIVMPERKKLEQCFLKNIRQAELGEASYLKNEDPEGGAKLYEKREILVEDIDSQEEENRQLEQLKSRIVQRQEQDAWLKGYIGRLLQQQEEGSLRQYGLDKERKIIGPNYF